MLPLITFAGIIFPPSLVDCRKWESSQKWIPESKNISGYSVIYITAKAKNLLRPLRKSFAIFAVKKERSLVRNYGLQMTSK
jgi:hypothetical protein